MLKQSAIVTVFILFGATLLSVHAEEVHKLESITVDGQRLIAAERNSEKISVEEEVKPVVSIIPDVVENTSGVDIQRRSILTPKNSQVKIRGLDERRTLIMLDGRPLNGTGVMGGFFVDWTSLSLLDLETVDIGRGAFSARYGNTLGGTINLLPRQPGEEMEASATFGYKRYDTYSAGFTGSGTMGNFGTVLAGGYNETDGNLRNSEAERYDFSGSFHYFWGDANEVRVGVRHSEGDFNMPVENRSGEPGYDPDFPESAGDYISGPGIGFQTGDTHGDGSYFNKKRTELDLSATQYIAGIQTGVKLYYNHEDREDFINSFETGDRILEREAEPDLSWGWLLSADKLAGNHRLGFGTEGNYQGYGGTDNTFVDTDYFTSNGARLPMDGSDENDALRRHGVYVDDQWAVLENLDLYLGLRYEDYYGDSTVDQVTGYVVPPGRPAGFEEVNIKFDEEVLLPKIGAVYRLIDTLALHGRYARSTRMPDSPAFYWYHAGYRPEVDPRVTISRKDLTFEDADQYEVGVTFAGIPGMNIGLTGYYYEVDDYIRWIFGYSPSRVVYNIDEVEFKGVELDVSGRFWGNFGYFANLTWQDTQKSGDSLDASNALSDELSELPDLKINWGVKYEREDGMLAKMTCRWVDSRDVPYLGGDDNPDGTSVFDPTQTTLKTLDDFVTVDLFLRYPAWKGKVDGFVTAGVENLFDEDYEEEFDFPAPGQTFSIGIELNY